MSIPINPGTKVGALLEAYPGIDEVLIEWAPAFEKLRNPILRKTVAKVATLEQAARIGGVPVRDLVQRLREAAGQDASDEMREAAAEDPAAPPAWLNPDAVRETIDADAMLKTGVHPLGTVKEAVVALAPGEIAALTSSFRPEPLLEAMKHSGLAVFCHETAPGLHTSYFCRQTDDPELADRVGRHSCGSADCR